MTLKVKFDADNGQYRVTLGNSHCHVFESFLEAKAFIDRLRSGVYFSNDNSPARAA